METVFVLVGRWKTSVCCIFDVMQLLSTSKTAGWRHETLAAMHEGIFAQQGGVCTNQKPQNSGVRDSLLDLLSQLQGLLFYKCVYFGRYFCGL